MDKDSAVLHYSHIMALLLLCALFFIPGNGLVPLTNPDEVFYSLTAKEMADHHTWMVPYLFDHPQFEKPIFTYWMIRLAFLMFGVGSFSARFFPAVFALIGVISTYLLATAGFKNSRKGFVCAVIQMSAVFYIGLARTVFTDMIFSVFILMSLTSFYWGYTSNEKGKQRGIILFFVFSALATLTKGPLGFAFPILTVVLFLAFNKDLAFLRRRGVIWGIGIGCLIALPWYVFMIGKFGQSFIDEFFYNDHIRRLLEAEHESSDLWYFYPSMTFLTIFPWTFFFLAGVVSCIGKLRLQHRDPFHWFLACWIAVVFGICQAAHSKLASYIFPYFPAVAIITGSYVHDFIDKKNSGGKSFIPLLSAALVSALPVGTYIAAVNYLDAPASTTAAAIAGVFSVIVLATMVLTVLKNWRIAFVILLMIQVPLFLFGAMHWKENLSNTLSSKAACEYLLKTEPDVTGLILCSKGNVRGVRYYTQKQVAVVKINGSDFFSPHPIPFIDTRAKLLDMLRQQEKTFCIISPSTEKQIAKELGKNFEMTVLKRFPEEIVAEIRRIGGDVAQAGALARSYFKTSSKTG